MSRARRSPDASPGLFGPDDPPPSPKARARPIRPEAPVEEGAARRAVLFARVALNRPLRVEFTYAVPAGLESAVKPGMRVAVPFGRRREVGVVVSTQKGAPSDVKRLRFLARALDPEPIVGLDLLVLTRWLATEYACSWGEALAAVLPAGLKRESARRRVRMISATPGVEAAQLEALAKHPKQQRLLRTLIELEGPIELLELTRRLRLSNAPAESLERRGLARIESVEVDPGDPLDTGRVERLRPEVLTPAQDEAVRAISAPLGAGLAHTFLLQGVTGSGKTEVYLRAIERALELGRGAIVLVPEISLTPQTVGWFRSRFGDVAVLHSKMSDAQRMHTWLRVRRGELRVVVGARSALFAPVEKLGVVVVDEEHEPSFKQGSVPRYHAREVAVRRALQAGAVCVLGSATPSLESWRRAREGEYTRLLLPARVTGGRMPTVELVDLRTEPRSWDRLFSRALEARLRGTLERGEQAILFQNRRGYVPVLYCKGCEQTVRCASCSVGLTLHKRIARLVCHSCCEEIPVPAACPTCTRPGLKLLGAGSQRVEQELRQRFPGVRAVRMDSDTMLRREDYERTLSAFGRGEIDVLVGTQMIAKGLDFPRVTLVGIVLADSSMWVPDFRSYERTFQLIAQVAGRAGRRDLPGSIVVQTRMPEAAPIRFAVKHDYEGFAEHEDALRKLDGYPPHTRFLRAVIEDTDLARVTDTAERMAEALRAVPEPEMVVKDAGLAPVSLMRGRHRFQVCALGPRRGNAFERVRERAVLFAADVARPRIALDVDPVSMM